jgi:preprotein translocase subunit SecD
MFDEAEFISRTLRAGALPASLQQLEERTVGPTLGSDSVKKGEFAGVVGCVLVFIFMIVYYGMLGMVANIALGMNVLLILAILSTLGATLTLPGIAGIVLTVGMAVDANVIIFERIKDELRLGKGIQLAIKNGFDSALSAIIDSNLTTAITCVMLIQFGTGAIRGFAVTLIIGVITSVFTAVFVSKTFANLLTQKFKLKKVIRF